MRPLPHRNRGAGSDVSPAVRDYLGMQVMAAPDWKMVDISPVPPVPSRRPGDNNDFVIIHSRDETILAPVRARPTPQHS